MNSVLIIPLSCLHLTFLFAVALDVVTLDDCYWIKWFMQRVLPVKVNTRT